MYNPETLQLDYQTRYSTEETINQSVQSNRYVISEPSGLGLNLLFDADCARETPPPLKARWRC